MDMHAEDGIEHSNTQHACMHASIILLIYVKLICTCHCIQLCQIESCYHQQEKHCSTEPSASHLVVIFARSREGSSFWRGSLLECVVLISQLVQSIGGYYLLARPKLSPSLSACVHGVVICNCCALQFGNRSSFYVDSICACN